MRTFVFHISRLGILFCVVSNNSLVNPRRLCEPQTTLRFFCFILLCTVILNWRSSMTEFVSSRLCLIVFKTFCDRSRIRTHAHTRVPEFSTEEFLESGALDPRPSCRVYADICLCDLCFFKWVEFAFHRFILLNGLCHPFVKICI